MAGKYQESLDLFRKIYIKDGSLDKADYSLYSYNKMQYGELGKDYSYWGDGKSKIVGKSAFTPRVVIKPIMQDDMRGRSEVKEYRFFLTLDDLGKFDHHFDMFYTSNMDNIKEIDVTDMPAEDILNRVEQMLNMSNEEIMTMFNIQKTYSTKVKLELLIDDVVQQYFEQQGYDIKDMAYGPEWGIRKVADKGGCVKQESVGYDRNSLSKIIINEDESDLIKEDSDMISYKVLTPDENDISKIKIAIEEANVNSELGKLILQTLKERFTEKQIEEEQVEEEQVDSQPEQVAEEKTGAEKILEFMKENNLGTHDLSLALTMLLSKTSDKTNAAKNIVNHVENGRKNPENDLVEH